MSTQIFSRTGRRNRLVKTVGCAKTAREEELLLMLGKTEMARLQGMQSLFIEHDDLVVESFVNSISSDLLQIVGSKLILGKSMIKLGSLRMSAPTFSGALFCADWCIQEASLKRYPIFVNT